MANDLSYQIKKYHTSQFLILNTVADDVLNTYDFDLKLKEITKKELKQDLKKNIFFFRYLNNFVSFRFLLLSRVRSIKHFHSSPE